MIPYEIYELGNMLGMKHKEISDVISNKQAVEIQFDHTSPKAVYPKGSLYLTICIKDF